MRADMESRWVWDSVFYDDGPTCLARTRKNRQCRNPIVYSTSSGTPNPPCGVARISLREVEWSAIERGVCSVHEGEPAVYEHPSLYPPPSTVATAARMLAGDDLSRARGVMRAAKAKEKEMVNA